MNSEVAVFAGGCFWCTEAIFQQVKGVTRVISGYAGPKMEKPSYVQMIFGKTDFAESIQITFNPQIVSFKDLVYIFLRVHDPTTLNRQGVDVGRQYRSAIFYRDEQQRQIAEEEIATANKEIYNGEIVTEVTKLIEFHDAEDYHQDYYKKNQGNSYCNIMIDPKLAKFKKEFSKYLKD